MILFPLFFLQVFEILLYHLGSLMSTQVYSNKYHLLRAHLAYYRWLFVYLYWQSVNQRHLRYWLIPEGINIDVNIVISLILFSFFDKKFFSRGQYIYRLFKKYVRNCTHIFRRCLSAFLMLRSLIFVYLLNTAIYNWIHSVFTLVDYIFF